MEIKRAPGAVISEEREEGRGGESGRRWYSSAPSSPPLPVVSLSRQHRHQLVFLLFDLS